MPLADITTVVKGRVMFEAVHGKDEETATVEPFESFELAHAYALKMKDEGAVVAFARETPIEAIEEATDTHGPIVAALEAIDPQTVSVEARGLLHYHRFDVAELIERLGLSIESSTTTEPAGVAAEPSDDGMWPHRRPRFSGVDPSGWPVLGPDTDEHPDVGAHPLRALAALVDRDIEHSTDPDPAALLADIGTARLARLLVMCAAMLDPGQAREALAEANSLARTMAELQRRGRAGLRKAERD